MSSIFSVPELAVGVGLSEAASAAFEPKVEVPKQSAWLANPQRVPDLGLIAQLVAGGKVAPADGHNMANRLGFSNGTMDSLVWLAQNRLDFPLMLRMWRLGAFNPTFADIDSKGFVDETLAHENLDWNYRPYLRALLDAELPGIGDIAYAVVRGYLPTDIPLPVAPPSTSTNVKRFPQSNTKAETLAAAIGYSQDMLELMIARSGLSMAPGLAAQARFRQILADDDYHLAIAEGDLRTEWADALLETSRAIPSPDAFAELVIRGWLSFAEGAAGAALHGMSLAHFTLLYEQKRRPLSPHQVKQALARGASFNPDPGEITDPYTASARQSSVGPEWEAMYVALQGSYPSLFQTNRLVTGGTITPTVGADWLTKSGMADEVVTEIHNSWTGASTTTADKNVTSAETHLKTATHKSYIAHEISDTTATTALGAAGVAAAAIPTVLTIWQEERSLIRKSLTAANLKKAVTDGVTNPATGAAWTHADAITGLLDLGYSQDDATTYLEL